MKLYEHITATRSITVFPVINMIYIYIYIYMGRVLGIHQEIAYLIA